MQQKSSTKLFHVTLLMKGTQPYNKQVSIRASDEKVAARRAMKHYDKALEVISVTPGG